MLSLPFEPIALYGLVLAVIDNLVNNIIDFEAHMDGFVSYKHSLSAPEVTDEACFFVYEIVIETCFTVRVSAKCSDTFLE